MGDCGSLLLGFLMCSFSLQLMEATNPYNDTLALSGNQATLILCSLFSLPVFDLLRVMSIRLTNGKHIFHADRNHLHHYLTDKLGKSHLVAAFTLFLIHLSIIMIAFIWVY
jgi:UDP-N-acetylmuramyl pentapeptide phosphotransferase/UDP-N-acetylglucosamine-1-phosphate transferase